MNAGPFDSLSDTSLDTEVGTAFSYIDNLTLTRGRRTLKFGVDIRRIRLNNSGNTLTTSSISYTDAQSFVNNSAASATYLQGEGVVGNRRTFYQGYAQDEFNINPKLTLNLGLRYEYYSVMHEILNRSAVVDIAGCGGLCPKGTPYYNPNTKDFGPRLGLAWASDGRTSIRTGFGIFYGGNQNDDFSDLAESACRATRWRKRIFRRWHIRWWRSSIPRISPSARRPLTATAKTCPTTTGISWCSAKWPRLSSPRSYTPPAKVITCSIAIPLI